MYIKFYIKSLAVSFVTLALLGCGDEDEAKKLGFSNTSEMKEIQAKGWHTMQRYDEDRAKASGFASVAEMKAAEEAKRKAEEAKVAASKQAKEAGLKQESIASQKKSNTITRFSINTNSSRSYESSEGHSFWLCSEALSDEVIRIVMHEMNIATKNNNQRGVDENLCYVGKTTLFKLGEFDTIEMYADAEELRKWRSGEGAEWRNVVFFPFKNGRLMRSYSVLGKGGKGSYGACFDEDGNPIRIDKNCMAK
jgi:hypothetical protein